MSVAPCQEFSRRERFLSEPVPSQLIARHTFNKSGVEIVIFDGNHRYYAEWAEKLA